MNGEQIRIVIADDHILAREGLRAMLATDNDLLIVGEASDGESLLQLVEQHQPDLVLTDIIMPVMDGKKAGRSIRDRYPATGLIATCTHEGEYEMLMILGAGFNGIVLKSASREEYFEAIREVINGGSYYCRDAQPAITSLIIKQLFHPGSSIIKDPLSAREKQILILICEGLSSKFIGEKLQISNRTVDTFRMKLLEKTGCSNLATLISYAYKEGMLN
ncbi:MAG: response regulator transcription factor [Ferruginibacter sp.]